MRLKGKVTIITGAGNGIGRSMALKFAEEGASVVVADIDEQKARHVMREISGLGGTAIAIHTDVSRKEDTNILISKTIDEFETIDILINNAGVLHSTALEDITEEEWDKIFDINMKGTFLCSQAALKVMKEKRTGCIINIGSSAGRDGGVSTGLAYSASKAAVIGFTRGLAKRVAKYGITCNCIAPGTTKSDMLSTFGPKEISALLDTIPLSKLGDPEDIAELACFIASKCGSFMTGATIDINGGLFIG